MPQWVSMNRRNICLLWFLFCCSNFAPKWRKKGTDRRTQRAAPFFWYCMSCPVFLVPYWYDTIGFLMGRDLMSLLIDANPACPACSYFSQSTTQPMTVAVTTAMCLLRFLLCCSDSAPKRHKNGTDRKEPNALLHFFWYCTRCPVF